MAVFQTTDLTAASYSAALFGLAATAILLLVQRPQGVSPSLAWIGVGLVAVIWASTAFLQVPAHARLSGGFDAETASTLVSTNWIRTVAWTARGCVALLMLDHALRTASR